jgi:transposase-like protein
MQAKALQQLRTGQSLTGKDGAFAPLLKEFIETALSAEMEGHLNETEREKGNKRNGKGHKTLKNPHCR